MEQIKLARLAVAAAPYLIDKPYTYTVPDALEPVLERGMRCLFPLAGATAPQKRWYFP